MRVMSGKVMRMLNSESKSANVNVRKKNKHAIQLAREVGCQHSCVVRAISLSGRALQPPGSPRSTI